ncbi:3-oxoacyl-[acyl-carrier-protein] reductase FabG [Halioglobus japonicus]|nr:3-oxoacyl-[acyl-carrier-protein] reductase FabG [Halioglobus japonicus]
MSDGAKAVALVTGAGGAIGGAIAESLHRAGWEVIGVDRQFSNPAAGYLAQSVVVDLSDQMQLRHTLQQLLQTTAIECLVNCAGISEVKPFAEQDPAMWQQLLDVNYLAPLTTCQTLLPAMIARQRGTIIQITSDSSRTGAAGEAAYAGSKAALVAFSKSLAQEVGRFQVRVNCVSPGVIVTPMSAPNKDLLEKFAKRVPMKRLGDPEDIAGAVKFLASDEAKYITGQIVSVGGGLTMVD